MILVAPAWPVRPSRKATKGPTGHAPRLPVSAMASSSLLAPFRVRSFRFQYPADLLTSWGTRDGDADPRLVHPGRDRFGPAAHPVRLAAVFRHAGRAGVRHGGRSARPPRRAVRDARQLRRARGVADDARLHRRRCVRCMCSSSPRSRAWCARRISRCAAPWSPTPCRRTASSAPWAPRAPRRIPRAPSDRSPAPACSPHSALGRPMPRSPCFYLVGFLLTLGVSAVRHTAHLAGRQFALARPARGTGLSVGHAILAGGAVARLPGQPDRVSDDQRPAALRRARHLPRRSDRSRLPDRQLRLRCA